MTGSLTANGGIICDTDKFVVADGTGNTTIGGTLGVAGKSNFSEDVSFNKNVTIEGNLTVEQYSNTAIINTTTTNYTLIVAEDLSLNGRMFISEDISLNKDLFVGDKSILHGDVSMNSRVDIGGDVSMNKQLQVAGGIIGNVTGNVTGSVATVSAAAQPAITSVGTLTSLAVDNISLDSNTISASTGALNLTPAAGSALVLDGTINVDAGVVTGATSITSTAFVGDLTGNVTGNVSGTAATVTGAAQTAITSVGTLTALNVDNLSLDGNTITI